MIRSNRDRTTRRCQEKRLIEHFQALAGIMGWFSADEIVAPVSNSENKNENHTAQTVALCVLAAVAVGYIAVKILAKLHRQQTERVAERAARLATLPA